MCRIGCWTVVLALSMLLAACSEVERQDQSPATDVKQTRARQPPLPSADCGVDGPIVAIAGRPVDPGIRTGRPLPVELERAVARALPFSVSLQEFESVEVSDNWIVTLRSADGVQSRPGSRDSSIEAALVDDGEGEPFWLVVTWQIWEPCPDD